MNIQQPTPTAQEIASTLALIAKLTAENDALKAQAAKPKSNGAGLKVSAKGALSVYGMGRFPVTLYSSQWLALLDRKEEILAFLKANSTVLKVKEA